MNDNKYHIDIDLYIDILMAKKYKVVLTPLSEEDGGGWLAEVPELPGCMTDGETEEEALRELESAKRAWFNAYRSRSQLPTT